MNDNFQNQIINCASLKDRWNKLCVLGKLYRINEVAEQTGLQQETLLQILKTGIPITGGRNRLQHLCFIPPYYIGSDSESTT